MVETIDYAFPFVVFVYGLMMTFVLNNPTLMEIAQNRLPDPILTQFKAHRTLGFVCLVFGALWSLQNIWVG